MNYYGLFEGISGFGLAFKRAGATIKAVCEIDKTCQSVLRRHHPEAEIISDVKTISKNTFPSGATDVLAGGFPCQDVSVAGLRKGLAGERSGLWFEFMRIIGDHKPRWVVIENVPGLLSSNGGRDFAVVLRGLVERGYGVCWRVFDSQYDGVAQRRNRVFIVASLGSASCAEVLFERDGSARDSPPRREAGEDVAVFTASSFGGYSEGVGTLRANGGNHGGGSETVVTVAPTLRSNGDAHSGFTTGDGLVMAFTTEQTPKFNKEQALTLTKQSPTGGGQVQSVFGQFGVRRLTPTECERLQGFPDGWTAFGHDGKPISDSARYRMLGNAVCVPTAEWIAKRLVKEAA